MSAASKLALFGAGLVLVFVGALGVGAAVGPTTESPARDHVRHAVTTTLDPR